MSGRIFSLDAATKTIEKFHYDEETGKFHIESKQEVSDLIDANREHKAAGVNKKAFQRLAARVPENIYWYWQMKWRHEGRSSAEIMEMWKKFLNDPEHKDFKTIEGRI